MPAGRRTSGGCGFPSMIAITSSKKYSTNGTGRTIRSSKCARMTAISISSGATLLPTNGRWKHSGRSTITRRSLLFFEHDVPGGAALVVRGFAVTADSLMIVRKCPSVAARVAAVRLLGFDDEDVAIPSRGTFPFATESGMGHLAAIGDVFPPSHF